MVGKWMATLILGIAFVACAKKNEPVQEVEMQATPEAEAPQAPVAEQKGAAQKQATRTPKTPAVANANNETTTPPPPAEGAMTCKNGEDVRTIEIVSREGGGCAVMYGKFGEKSEVAYAINETSYCTEVSERIKGNLTGAGFTCGAE